MRAVGERSEPTPNLRGNSKLNTPLTQTQAQMSHAHTEALSISCVTRIGMRFVCRAVCAVRLVENCERNFLSFDCEPLAKWP